MIGPSLDAPGGIASVARSVLDAPELAGLEVRYFSSVASGGGLVRLRSTAGGQLRWLGALSRGWRPDVVHVHMGSPVLAGRGLPVRYTSFWRKWLYLAEARARGCPVVLQLHGSDGLVHLHDRSVAGARLVTRCLRRASMVLTLSQDLADRVNRWVDEAVPVRVLVNPVAVEPEPASQAQRPPVVLFLGRISEAKGAFDLLQAVPEVLARVPGARFCFGGEGERDRLLAEAARLGVADRVEAPGWLQGEAKRRAFARAAVFCLPSYFEGLPVGVLEALAAGLPVVATPIAGIPDAVTDGEHGLLVPVGQPVALAQALARLLADPALRGRMGEAGHARARSRYDRPVVVRRLRQLWDEAAGAG